MLKIRTQLIHASFSGLCRALTIGVRYSIQRTQFFDEVDGKKIPKKVFNYQTQMD